jgi:predicted Zn-dependent peptidase
MINFDKFTLKNGLTVIVHNCKDTPMVAINILYKVGSKNENPEHTGFAHLFEHLMFGGSLNIPDYDIPLQKVGGDNNAWTSNDYTNFYITLPKENIETGFWLESDRMLSLDFNQKSLDTQKSVVIEEFKQRYFNQPYGDVFLLLKPLAYKKHPYQWPTIGKSIEHIEKTKLQHVKDFFQKHYSPNNAIMVVSGNVTVMEIKKLSEKWFNEIPAYEKEAKNIPIEPTQTEARQLTVHRDVPADAIYIAFHMVDKKHPDYYKYDLISDILSNGQSARLYKNLVKEKNIFSQLDAYITGDNHAGLFIVSGRLADNIDMKQAEEEIWAELNNITENEASEYELQKVKNKIESNIVFGEISYLNKAMNLANFEALGDANNINYEAAEYQKISTKDLKIVAQKLFIKENSSTLYYHSKKQ